MKCQKLSLSISDSGKNGVSPVSHLGDQGNSRIKVSVDISSGLMREKLWKWLASSKERPRTSHAGRQGNDPKRKLKDVARCLSLSPGSPVRVLSVPADTGSSPGATEGCSCDSRDRCERFSRLYCFSSFFSILSLGKLQSGDKPSRSGANRCSISGKAGGHCESS